MLGLETEPDKINRNILSAEGLEYEIGGKYPSGFYLRTYAALFFHIQLISPIFWLPLKTLILENTALDVLGKLSVFSCADV